MLNLIAGSMIGSPIIGAAADRFDTAGRHRTDRRQGLAAIQGLAAGGVEKLPGGGPGTVLAGLRILQFASTAAGPAVVGFVLARSESAAQFRIGGVAVAASVVVVVIGRTEARRGVHAPA